MREEGLSGRTTVFEDPLFEGLSGISAILPCLLTHEPVDLLLIMLGTNDTKARFNISGENIAKGMERLVRKAAGETQAWKKGRPNILIIAPPPIEEGYDLTPVAGEMGAGCLEKSKLLTACYEQTAKLTCAHFLDAGRLSGISMHPNDHMHLTEESHKILALELARVIPLIVEI